MFVNNPILKDKIRGCLVGGAVGDALGYQVEFISRKDIEQQYGNEGVRRYEPTSTGIANISDDTQMSLFTAGGLLNGMTRCILEDKASVYAYMSVKEAYIEWVDTQTGYIGEHPNCWFAKFPFMNEQRAPGETCITVLNKMKYGETSRKYSKGCGGVMRTAPVALFYAGLHNQGQLGISIQDEAAIAGNLAWLTHRHPLGWLPSCALHFLLISLLEGSSLMEAASTMLSLTQECLGRWKQAEIQDEGMKLLRLLELAIKLGESSTPSTEAFEQLGEGWVGDEALAIAVYSAVRFRDSEQRFEDAVCCAVNHSGDSDSTGAICGQIMGAWLGFGSIPRYYLSDKDCTLEGLDLLTAIAEDLYEGCPFEHCPNPLEITGNREKRWFLRYVLKENCSNENIEKLWEKHYGE